MFPRTFITKATVVFYAILIALGGWASPQAAQPNVQVTLDVWPIPTADSLPGGIEVDSVDGQVYFTEFRGGKIGRLDPASDRITEWPALDGPNELRVARSGGSSLVLSPPLVYYTASTANAVSVLDPVGGSITADFAITAGSAPGGIALDARGASPQVWFSGRSANTLGRFDPARSQGAIGAAPTTTNVSRNTLTHLFPATTTVVPTVTRGNPALPPAAAFAPPASAGPYTEWDLNAVGFTRGAFPKGVGLDGAGHVWLASPNARTLLRFDGQTFFAHDLPQGSGALNLDFDAAGNVWFTQSFLNKIGMLVPLTGDVFEWAVPHGGQPFDITIDPATQLVWFTQREGQRIGFLDPSTNEFTQFDIQELINPLYIALDGNGGVWFTAERANFVARLSLAALGTPPAAPEGNDVHTIAVTPNAQVTQADIDVDYTYSGDQGFRAFLRVEVLVDGQPHPDFFGTDAEMFQVGRDQATVPLFYRGNACLESDGFRVLMRTPGAGTFYSEDFSAPLRWGCASQAAATDLLSVNLRQDADTFGAQLDVELVYDGAFGTPVFVTAVPTSGGTPLWNDFGNVPAAIEAVGHTTQTVRVNYLNKSCLNSDGMLVLIYNGDGQTLYSEVFNAQLGWGCGGEI